MTDDPTQDQLSALPPIPSPQAPRVTISVGPIQRPGPAPQPGPKKVVRSDSGAWLDEHLVDVLGVGVASGAFWKPAAWLALVVVIALAIGAVRSARADGRITGADLVVVPAKALRRGLKALAPGSLLRGLVFGAVLVAASIALPAALAALPWLASRGSEGALAAARLGARAHALQFLAAGFCFLIVRGRGDGHRSRQSAIKKRTDHMTEGGVSFLAVGVLLIALLVATTIHSDGDLFTGQDGLGWVPAPFRSSVDEARDSFVQSELDSVAECLSEELGDNSSYWYGVHSEGNPIEDMDVARLTVDPQPQANDLVTAALAAHNQLAPWVESVEIALQDGRVLLAFNRAPLRSDVPLTSAEAINTAVTQGAESIAGTPQETINEPALLKCSSSTL